MSNELSTTFEITSTHLRYVWYLFKVYMVINERKCHITIISNDWTLLCKDRHSIKTVLNAMCSLSRRFIFYFPKRRRINCEQNKCKISMASRSNMIPSLNVHTADRNWTRLSTAETFLHYQINQQLQALPYATISMNNCYIRMIILEVFVMQWERVLIIWE